MLLENAHDDDRSAYALNPGEVAELDTLIMDRYDRPAAWISNLLCAIYGHCRPPMTGSGGEPQRRQILRRPIVLPQKHAKLVVQPNPATTATAFVYTLKQTPSDAWLTVVDPLGRVVHRVRVTQEQGTVSWGIQNMAAGVYTVTIAEQGKVLLYEKLVIQP